jgi:hypothetical protein
MDFIENPSYLLWNFRLMPATGYRLRVVVKDWKRTPSHLLWNFRLMPATAGMMPAL